MESTSCTSGVAPPEAISIIRKTGSDKRGDRSIAELHLPQHILDVLHAEGVRDLDDWRRLGRKRKAIFGIIPSLVRILDAAAKEARTS